MTTKTPAAGTVFHVLSALSFALSPHQSVSATRAQEYTVTEEMIAASLDRRGNSWLALIGDEEGQIKRWGSVKVAPGPTPESVEWWNGDPATQSLARNLARESVIANTKDPATRAELMAKVDATFGKVSTSQSIPYIA